MEKPTTPEFVTSRIRAFLRQAGLEGPPVYLPFTLLDERYRSGFCFDNCAHAAKAGLGAIVFGWVIWDAAKFRFTEGEFHAVLSTGSALLDITPRKDGEDKILFIPDPARVATFKGIGWEGYSNIISRDGIVRSAQPTFRGDITYFTYNTQ